MAGYLVAAAFVIQAQEGTCKRRGTYSIGGIIGQWEKPRGVRIMFLFPFRVCVEDKPETVRYGAERVNQVLPLRAPDAYCSNVEADVAAALIAPADDKLLEAYEISPPSTAWATIPPR